MKKMIAALLQNIRQAAAKIAAPFARATPPEPVNCGNINLLLLHLCDFDYELHGWVLRWLAYPLRNPGVKMDRALIVNGGEGTGKTLFFNHVMGALYQDQARAIRPNSLAALFTRWVVGARYVVVDGVLTRRVAQSLKHYITSPTLTVNENYKAPYQLPNHINFVFLSGSENFLPLDAGDRRFAIIETPPKREPRFYRAIADEISNGGVEVFRHFLMHDLDMTGFDEQTPPPSSVRAGVLRKAA